MTNLVYIAASLDGFISDKDDGLDWLQSIPNPNNLDFGYASFIDRIDAIVMGRKTFEKVCSFDCDWPYSKPVFVLSNSLSALPEEYERKAELITGLVDGSNYQSAQSRTQRTLHRRRRDDSELPSGRLD